MPSTRPLRALPATCHRSIATPVLLFSAAAAAAAVAGAYTFVAGATSRAVAPFSPPSVREAESRVAMKGRGWPPGNMVSSASVKAAVREKQARLMKERSKGRGGSGKKATTLQWPAKKEDGITLFHVEYDQDQGKRADDPIFRIEKLFKATQNRFGHKIRIIVNYKPALKDYSPTGSFRKDSFEVINVHTNQRIFSMLDTGKNPVESDADLDFLMNRMATFIE
mmetsp:Transcript_16265/g.43811  ORF Transcript_16265/g.43811 Transcript_16265/m.43811 type:complete len:223 (+) Transcript_16265:84-752(+)